MFQPRSPLLFAWWPLKKEGDATRTRKQHVPRLHSMEDRVIKEEHYGTILGAILSIDSLCLFLLWHEYICVTCTCDWPAAKLRANDFNALTGVFMKIYWIYITHKGKYYWENHCYTNQREMGSLHVDNGNDTCYYDFYVVCVVMVNFEMIMSTFNTSKRSYHDAACAPSMRSQSWLATSNSEFLLRSIQKCWISSKLGTVCFDME